MSASRLQATLGCASDERLLVVHADDVGMCEASVAAYRELSAAGVVCAASTMVPCGWFPAVAEWCRALPARVDMGVHLTLNSEWKRYRWGPLMGPMVPSLRDEAGYFLSSPEVTCRQADVNEVYLELRAQIERALSCGIDVTHIDSHILTLKRPELLSVYIRLSREFRIPSGLTRRPDQEIERLNLPHDVRREYYDRVSDADGAGLVALQSWAQLPLEQPTACRVEAARMILGELRPGITVLISHPAADSAELRAITSDWPGRVADYELFRSDAWPRALESAGVRTVGMRAIRDALFGDAVAS
jgi:predicted glycoside hydrolase/deacetylase ChbG (UPF0249 family)